ncbi:MULTISPECIES: YgjV family protein [unclassified Pseudoalteromonas]|uniref:YgjV family protein n=1 Tax=unclassified Pseudoalteromonas TaxID=194690 RepID=UPI001602DCF2|nr:MULTISPECIES: YgjV family protein [unclassified Pseudoalteromonas]MBB1333661.1 YgjV family protein [Pseudoalteromonas sp. SR41-6]MBB1459387.1 YgjV family protein [Pseudoalteromonas sp. SG41-8]
MFLVSQCLVAIATLLDLASFQFKSRKLILLCLFSSVLLTATHFFLLDKISASLLMLIAAVRYFYCIFNPSQWAMLGFMLLSTVAVILTWQGWLSGLALLATLIQTFASFQPRDMLLRLFMVFGTALWISHNLLVGSPMAVLMECLFLLSNLVGLWRFYFWSKEANRAD